MSRRKLTKSELEDAGRLKSVYEAYKQDKLPEKVTQELVAFECGFKTQSAFSQYVNGKIPLNLDVLLIFSRFFGVNPEKISPELAAVLPYESADTATAVDKNMTIEPVKNYPRVVGTARCGDNGYYEDLEGGDGYLEFERPYGSIAIRIVGHSMHPAIRDGWYVIIDPNKTPELGEFVLLKFKCGRKMVKELLQIKSDSYLVVSLNGGERITAMFDDLEGDIQAVSAVVPPSMHREW